MAGFPSCIDCQTFNNRGTDPIHFGCPIIDVVYTTKQEGKQFKPHDRQTIQENEEMGYEEQKQVQLLHEIKDAIVSKNVRFIHV